MKCYRENKVKYRLLNIYDVYKHMSLLKLFQLPCNFANYIIIY